MSPSLSTSPKTKKAIITIGGLSLAAVVLIKSCHEKINNSIIETTISLPDNVHNENYENSTTDMQTEITEESNTPNPNRAIIRRPLPHTSSDQTPSLPSQETEPQTNIEEVVTPYSHIDRVRLSDISEEDLAWYQTTFASIFEDDSPNLYRDILATFPGEITIETELEYLDSEEQALFSEIHDAIREQSSLDRQDNRLNMEDTFLFHIMNNDLESIANEFTSENIITIARATDNPIIITFLIEYYLELTASELLYHSSHANPPSLSSFQLETIYNSPYFNDFDLDKLVAHPNLSANLFNQIVEDALQYLYNPPAHNIGITERTMYRILGSASGNPQISYSTLSEILNNIYFQNPRSYQTVDIIRGISQNIYSDLITIVYNHVKPFSLDDTYLIIYNMIRNPHTSTEILQDIAADPHKESLHYTARRAIENRTQSR